MRTKASRRSKAQLLAVVLTSNFSLARKNCHRRYFYKAQKYKNISSGSSSKSLIIKPPQFWFMMKSENADIAVAMASISGKIRGQNGKAWVVKDLGFEPLVMSEKRSIPAHKLRTFLQSKIHQKNQ